MTVNSTGKRATMRQVAQMVGVSAMTVSKALGNKGGVSEKTRQRILAAAAQLRYTPNMLAKSFRTDRTNTIGVILSADFAEVFTTLFKGVESVAAELGFSTLVASSSEQPDRMEAVVQMLAAKRVDGIVLTSSHVFSKQEKAVLDRTGIPYVLAVRSCCDSSVTTVINNNYTGGYSLVDYLAETGSRRFLLLAMAKRLCSSAERLRGWSEALRRHRLTPVAVKYIEPAISDGYQTMADILSGGLSIDAVVCGNDMIAVGVMEALLEKGVAIPGQVRVGGYDGVTLSAYFRIPLTTIEQPMYEIGQTCMNLLSAKIDNPDTPPQQVVINGKLVIRQST